MHNVQTETRLRFNKNPFVNLAEPTLSLSPTHWFIHSFCIVSCPCDLRLKSNSARLTWVIKLLHSIVCHMCSRVYYGRAILDSGAMNIYIHVLRTYGRRDNLLQCDVINYFINSIRLDAFRLTGFNHNAQHNTKPHVTTPSGRRHFIRDKCVYGRCELPMLMIEQSNYVALLHCHTAETRTHTTAIVLLYCSFRLAIESKHPCPIAEPAHRNSFFFSFGAHFRIIDWIHRHKSRHTATSHDIFCAECERRTERQSSGENQ